MLGYSPANVCTCEGIGTLHSRVVASSVVTSAAIESSRREKSSGGWAVMLISVMQYHNIFALVRELGIENPFTDCTTSGYWSPQGLTTEAPVFSRRPQLPTMLGQFVHTLPLFR